MVRFFDGYRSLLFCSRRAAGLGFNLGKTVDAEFKYAGWKQHLVGLHGTSGGTGGTGGYGPTGGTGGTGGKTGGGGGYSLLRQRNTVIANPNLATNADTINKRSR